jgi:peptide/nickel transport system permease protein
MTHARTCRPPARSGAYLGALLAVGVLAVAVAGPALTGDPNRPDYTDQLAAPSSAHWLGTDAAGRDAFARLVAGTRASLRAVAIVFLASTAIGMLLGALAGYLRGAVDAVLSRVIDVALSLPSLIVALAIVGALGVGAGNLVLALVATGWAYPARITRSLVLDSHTRLDILAARMAGIGRVRILRTHVLPGTVAAVLVAVTATIAETVLALAGLSFLGLGAQPPHAELGQLLTESQTSLHSAPWLLAGPTVMVAAMTAAAMLLSDALRDATAAVPAARGARATSRRPARRPTGTSAVEPVPHAPPLTLTGIAVTYGNGVCAVQGVDLQVRPGECLALVGESGCGKTTLARVVLGLLPPDAHLIGSARVAGTDIADVSPRQLRGLRGRRVGYIAQDPYAACDPLRSVRHHVEEAWRIHRIRPPRDAAGRRVADLGVTRAAERIRERPHRWSGGMLQRATIAAANVHRPVLTVADEPTSALDAELADDVLAALRADSRAVLLISHDLRLVARHSDRVAVMHHGRIIETGPTTKVLADPDHPHTRALLAASTAQPGDLPPQLTVSQP